VLLTATLNVWLLDIAGPPSLPLSLSVTVTLACPLNEALKVTLAKLACLTQFCKSDKLP
jgi:hypothetical protein